MKWITIVAIAFLMACGGDASEKEKNNGFDLGEADLGMDVGSDMGGPGDMGPIGTIQFRMVNDTAETLYAGIPGASCLAYPFVKVQGIDAARILSPGCDECICADEQCQICDCAQATAEAYRFEPGAELTFEWDKRFWDFETNPGPQCLSPRMAQFQNYAAEFCFIDEFDDNRTNPIRQLCTTLSFNIDDESLTHTITNDDLPGGPTEFRLVNNTGDTIFARPSTDYCYGTWLSLTLDGNRVQRGETCGVGLCSEGGGEQPCPAGACAPPTRETFELQDGESRNFVWRHVYWQKRDLEGTICEWPSYVSSGTEASADFCWATSISEDGVVAVLGNETCETITFDTSENLVEYVVE